MHLSPKLEAIELSVRYSLDSPLQLEHVSLTLEPGEVVAVIGPNGSGKSTLIRTLSRTLLPEQGQVLLNDSDLYEKTSSKTSAQFIAVMPQSTEVFLDFTVRDIVAMGRAPRRKSSSLWTSESVEDVVAVDAALEKMAIDQELAHRPISQVSGGERQRALIARMLAQEATFLLLDEPTAALDIYNESVLLSWLKQLARVEQRGILIVLHDLNIASSFADKIIIMDKGRVEASGTPDQVMTAENIERVYGIRSWVRRNPATYRPAVFTLPQAEQGGEWARLSGIDIHLFCGLGTGVKLMFELDAMEAKLTASILSSGDPDREAADFLHIRYAEVKPFSFPSNEAIALAKELAFAANMAVFTNVPIGDTNLDVLSGAKDFADSGRRLICLVPDYESARASYLSQFDRYPNVIFAKATDEVIESLIEGLGVNIPL